MLSKIEGFRGSLAPFPSKINYNFQLQRFIRVNRNKTFKRKFGGFSILTRSAREICRWPRCDFRSVFFFVWLYILLIVELIWRFVVLTSPCVRVEGGSEVLRTAPPPELRSGCIDHFKILHFTKRFYRFRSWAFKTFELKLSSQFIDVRETRSVRLNSPAVVEHFLYFSLRWTRPTLYTLDL